MTPAEVITRLFTGPITPERVKKAQALTARSKLSWAAVMSAMSPEQRQQVEGAQ